MPLPSSQTTAIQHSLPRSSCPRTPNSTETAEFGVDLMDCQVPVTDGCQARRSLPVQSTAPSETLGHDGEDIHPDHGFTSRLVDVIVTKSGNGFKMPWLVAYCGTDDGKTRNAPDGSEDRRRDRRLAVITPSLLSVSIPDCVALCCRPSDRKTVSSALRYANNMRGLVAFTLVLLGTSTSMAATHDLDLAEVRGHRRPGAAA